MRQLAACVAAFFGGGFFFLAPPYAAADLVEIGLSDLITISANARTASEFGSSPCASPTTTTGCFNPLSQTFPEGGEPASPFTHFIGFRPSTPTNPHGATFNTFVLLTEGERSISDIVELSAVALTNPDGTPAGQQWTLAFFSDPDGVVDMDMSLPTCVSTVPCTVTIAETGDVQDISGLFLNSDGVTRIVPLFNVLVESDVDVAEPSTLLLLGSGLAGLAGLVRRRARRT